MALAPQKKPQFEANTPKNVLNEAIFSGMVPAVLIITPTLRPTAMPHWSLRHPRVQAPCHSSENRHMTIKKRFVEPVLHVEATLAVLTLVQCVSGRQCA